MGRLRVHEVGFFELLESGGPPIKMRVVDGCVVVFQSSQLVEVVKRDEALWSLVTAGAQTLVSVFPDAELFLSVTHDLDEGTRPEDAQLALVAMTEEVELVGALWEANRRWATLRGRDLRVVLNAYRTEPS